jgi:hypothetical protein
MLNHHRWVFLLIRGVLALVFIAYGAMKLLWLQLAAGDLSDLRFGEIVFRPTKRRTNGLARAAGREHLRGPFRLAHFPWGFLRLDPRLPTL